MREALGKLITTRLFQNPIFVVGAGRSGTSILLQALGQHSHILSADRESPFIPYVGYLMHPFEFRDNKEYHITSLNLPVAYLYQSLRKLCFEAVMGEHYGFKTVTNGAARLADVLSKKRYWCAKTFPSQVESQGLVRLYPAVKFLYIFRNGYDVVNSRSHFGAMSRMSFEEHCDVWARHVEKYAYLLDMRQALPVRQENLVKDADQVFREIFAFTGIPYEDGPTRFTKTTHVHPLDKKTHTGTDVAKTLKERPPAYESWTAQQRRVFKEICGTGMQVLGYEIPF